MRIYLDHNAGTPIRPAVREAIAEFLASGLHGNPASVHRSGQYARRELERARARVAALVEAPARSIVFTSCGTEANNLAIVGVAPASGRRRIITSAIEHSSLLAPLAQLERHGFEVIRVRPDCDGTIDPEKVAREMDDQTALVTLGLANAEVGTIQELTPVAETAKRVGATFHLDAVQAAGRLPLAVDTLGCDLMTISAHKIGGPPGIGALYVRPETALAPIMLGGPQEAGLRAGTPNLMGAIGFGIAADESMRLRETETRHLTELSQVLLNELNRDIPALHLNGPRTKRLPNTLNLTFPDALGETFLMALDLEGIEVSMGSACAAGAVEPSHVLSAMGRSATEARSSIRISLGWSTTPEEIAIAGAVIPRAWRRVAGEAMVEARA